jgi:hypothetical protein
VQPLYSAALELLGGDSGCVLWEGDDQNWTIT